MVSLKSHDEENLIKNIYYLYTPFWLYNTKVVSYHIKLLSYLQRFWDVDVFIAVRESEESLVMGGIEVESAAAVAQGNAVHLGGYQHLSPGIRRTSGYIQYVQEAVTHVIQ